MRRFALPLLLLLGACSADPTTGHLFGIGDPVRGAALAAPVTLGDTSRLAGDPVAAARAVILLEFIDDAFRTDPLYIHDVSPANQQIIRLGRDEMRAAAGIAPDAPAGLLIAQLRDFANALETGSVARAEAALSGPMFPLGPAATMQRLRNLPRLQRVSQAGSAAADEISRLGGRRRTS